MQSCNSLIKKTVIGDQKLSQVILTFFYPYKKIKIVFQNLKKSSFLTKLVKNQILGDGSI